MIMKGMVNDLFSPVIYMDCSTEVENNVKMFEEKVSQINKLIDVSRSFRVTSDGNEQDISGNTRDA